MLKKLLTNYTFDASEKKITLSDYETILLESVLVITNVTDNIIIYNFADTTKGGSVATNVLTLDYNTTTMDDGDDLQIFYMDSSATQPISGTVTANLGTTDNAVLDDIALNQTDASQKTQVVDGAGNVIGATSNALDINIKSGNPTTIAVTQGTATNLKTQAEVYQGGSAVAVGNPLEVTLPAATVTTLTPPAAITGFATSAKQLPDGHTVALSATDNAVLDTIDSVLDTINAKLVTGTVIGDVNLGATDNAVLDTIAAKDFATQTTLAAINAKLVTGTDIGDVTINNSTGANAVNIQDGGNVITVDGTVAVTNAGITTIAGAVAGTEMQVDVLTMPTVTVNSHAVTNAGTFAVQESGAALTALQLIDNAVSGAGFNITQFAGAAVPIGAGTEAAALRVTVATDSTGVLSVDDNGGALTVDGTVAVSACDITKIAGESIQVAGGTEAKSIRVTIASDSTGLLSVDDNGGSLTIDGTVTANLSATDNAVLDSIQTAVEVIDNCISGSEAQVDIVASLPAGTNAIGKLLPPDVDVTAHANYTRKYYTSAGAATDGIIWSPAAGKRWHVTSLYFQTSADATITFEDDKAGGDDVVLKGEYKAGSGIALTFDEKYPFASGEDAADLTVTTSAGNIYVSVVGYEI